MNVTFLLQLPITGPGKSIKSSSQSQIGKAPVVRPAPNAEPVLSGASTRSKRHADLLHKPNIANQAKNSDIISSTKTTSSKSFSNTNQTDDEKGDAKKIKICVKLPSSGREILSVDSNVTFQQIVAMLQKKKRNFSNPEFITCDVPANRVSGKKLASKLIDFGIDNNSVLHCDELL